MKITTRILFVCLLLNLRLAAGVHSMVNQKSETGFRIKIQFENQDYRIISGKPSRILFPDAMDESRPGSFMLPHKILYIALPPNDKSEISLLNKNSQTIDSVIPEINPQWESINDSTIVYKKVEPDSKMTLSELSEEVVEVLGYIWIRNYYVAVVKINTTKFSYSTNSVDIIEALELEIKYQKKSIGKNVSTKLGDFDNSLRNVILNYDDAQEFQKEGKDTSTKSDNWIDFDKIHIKLSTYNDGIYRISHSDLISFGVDPSNLNPKTIKLYVAGKQMPLYVSGESDGMFNKEDYIEFYSHKNYESNDYTRVVNIGEPYINYLNRYSDTTFVWLVWGGEDGKRISLRNSPERNGLDNVSTHISKLHLEQDERLWYYTGSDPRYQLPIWSENKVFTWLFLGQTGSVAAKFNAENIVPNTIVDFTTRLISNASNITKDAHEVGFSINSATASDTLRFDFKSTQNFYTGTSSSKLKEGANQINLFGFRTNATTNQVLIDWVDVSYTQQNIMKGDTLLIQFNDSFTEGLRNITIKNVEDADNVELYRLKPKYEKIVNFSKYSTLKQIVFSDTVYKESTYFIAGITKINKVRFLKKKKFIDLLNNPEGADYVLISNRAYSNSTSEYEKFVKDQYKLRTYTAYIDDLYDQFTNGYPEPEAIKYFLSSVFNVWAVPSPSYLLLLGDANYDYKTLWKPLPQKIKTNFVPSYGQPVSDNWFCTFSPSNIGIPQMYVGRIPIQNDQQLSMYLERHKNYVNKKVDLFNKKYILFSGGDPANLNELSNIKSANDLLYKLVTADSIGGVANHFYKTINPSTNFGPVSHEDFQSAIDSGAVVISYSGHSGTRTWDNGINEVKNLKNSSQISPLISDFGCSTGRFAEPDVDSFSELFVSQSLDGQAIAYIGNSNLGFLSTATKFPSFFYSELLNKENKPVGVVHFNAKIKQTTEGGFSEITRAFNYCNLLFGDPIIKISFPTKPNLAISPKDISTISNVELTDGMDSVGIRIRINNYGRGIKANFKISLVQELNGSIIFSEEIEYPIPPLYSYLIVNVPLKNNPGNNKLSIVLDKTNIVSELSEDDNTTSYEFYVASGKTKPLLFDKYFATGKIISLSFLNPHSQVIIKDPEIVLNLSSTGNFKDSIVSRKGIETVATKFNLSNLTENKRYWYRAMIPGVDQDWSEKSTFYYSNYSPRWRMDYLVPEEKVATESISKDTLVKGWTLNNVENKLTMTSAGSSDGKYASITLNDAELLPNAFFWGIATAILDTVTLTPTDIRYYTYPESQSSIALIKYLTELPNGTTLIIVVCDDAAQSVLSFDFNSNVRKLIESSFGSIYSRKVGYRESWCMVSKKGSNRGAANEVYKKQFEGLAIIELFKKIKSKEGYIHSPRISNSSKWESVRVEADIPTGGEINITPIGIRTNDKKDTLKTIPILNKIVSLNEIDSYKYPNLQFIIQLKANKEFKSPVLNSLSVEYTSTSELATNYQVVSLSKDSLDQGETANLNFLVYNVGESTASNFKVRVDIVKKDNSKEMLFEQLVDSVQTEKKKEFSLSYTADKITGSNQFQITIDPDNSVTELYKDNNFYAAPFYVKPNNKPATLRLTIDGSDIINGDFVSSKPNFKIELSDESLIPITDTTKILLYLNNKRIYFATNTNVLNYNYSATNPKMVVNYTPTLADGNYTFKVVGKNATDQIIDSTGIVRKFTVKNELQLLNAYNYPNPFKDDTYFTFKLTQIPDDLKIIIYTIAGRKIKEIKLSAAELKYDFNRIFWDGRDQDGDLSANGVYLYKIISQKGSERTEVTEKLAIIR